MAKLTFLGVGSAFAGRELGQSNMIVESDSGKLLLIDCGSRCQDMLEEVCGIANKDLGKIDGVYISHLHGDHVGGMEWLALCTYFNPTIRDKPKLYCIEDLMHEMWDSSLKGGLSTIQGGEATLTTYFDCQPLQINSYFVWEGIRFTPVQTVHVVSGYRIMHCYGLMIEQSAPVADHEHRVEEARKDARDKLAEGDFVPKVSSTMTWLKTETEDRTWKRTFLTTDTQFAPKQLQDFYATADLVFHDCETTAFRSNVHAHYDDLKTLPDEVKERMWLYHYNTTPEVFEGHGKARDDGFAGFVTKGKEFEI